MWGLCRSPRLQKCPLSLGPWDRGKMQGRDSRCSEAENTAFHCQPVFPMKTRCWTCLDVGLSSFL